MALNKKMIEKIKKDLIKRREQILKDIEAITAKDNNKLRAKFPEFGDKNDENAQEISEYSTNLATEKILKSTLRDIEAALKRIEDGTYGICKYCGKEIDEKRLLARPVASACISCKTKLQSGRG